MAGRENPRLNWTYKEGEKEEVKKKGGGGFTKLCILSPELTKLTGVSHSISSDRCISKLWWLFIYFLAASCVTVIITENPPKKNMFINAGLDVDSVLSTTIGQLKEQCELGKDLAQGDCGRTSVCVDRKAGESYECKSIAKRNLLTNEGVNGVREIEIMSSLSSRRNVVSTRGA